MKKRTIQSLQDVVEWGLCTGCGTCFSVCSSGAVTMVNIESIGMRPLIREDICGECRECLSFCPGYSVDGNPHYSSGNKISPAELLIGPALEIWEGSANDDEIRYRASSGGILSSLALYCLEKEGMEFVLHTGMDISRPWLNTTVQSRTRDDLILHAGSRYATSSPCDSLRLIEESPRPCVFIGKPCDVAAVSRLRRQRPELDRKLGLVLAFFCAGTPSSRGTLDLIRQFAVEPSEIRGLHYRGMGWPGSFRITCRNGRQISLSYEKSWDFLQRYRPFRCNLCPDGLGESGDIACGDAWHRRQEGDNGQSLILVRSGRGKEILQKAQGAGYLKLAPASASDVLAAQGLTQRRQELFGRLLAMRFLGIPAPCFKGFPLFRAWLLNSIPVRFRTVAGTIKRLMRRRLWHRKPLPVPGRDSTPKKGM